MPPLSDDGPDGSPRGRFVAFPELLRAAGRASDPRRVLLAALGMALLWAGWWAVEGATGEPAPYHGTILARFDLGYRPLDKVGATRLVDRPFDLTAFATFAAEPAVVVVEPFAQLFSRQTAAHDWFRWLLRGVWAVIVWGLVGGAIARVAAVREAAGGGVGIASSLRFALRRWMGLVGAPLTPFLAVAVLTLGCAGFGLLFRLPIGLSGTLTGALGFVPLLIGLVLALILLGLTLAWPLMVATVAVEGEDLADALSRSYSYINQRLARYLIHLALAWALGTVALGLAVAFARVVIGLADWGAALGASDGPPWATPDLFRGFWSDVVGWLVHAYAYSYFWTVTTALYVVFRRDVDGTDPHDVYLPEQATDPFAGPSAPPSKPPAEAELPA